VIRNRPATSATPLEEHARFTYHRTPHSCAVHCNVPRCAHPSHRRALRRQGILRLVSPVPSRSSSFPPFCGAPLTCYHCLQSHTQHQATTPARRLKRAPSRQLAVSATTRLLQDVRLHRQADGLRASRHSFPYSHVSSQPFRRLEPAADRFPLSARMRLRVLGD
jgi:hypothetical protein